MFNHTIHNHPEEHPGHPGRLHLGERIHNLVSGHTKKKTHPHHGHHHQHRHPSTSGALTYHHSLFEQTKTTTDVTPVALPDGTLERKLSTFM